MAWPPTIPTGTRTDITDQGALHPADHNQVAQALTDIVFRISNGETAYAQATTTQTGFNSSITAVTGVSVTFAALLGRVYKLTLCFTAQQLTSNSYQDAHIYVGASSVMRSTVVVPASEYITHTVIARLSNLSGTVTINGRFTTSAGTANIVSDSSRPAFILVEAIGGTA